MKRKLPKIKNRESKDEVFITSNFSRLKRQFKLKQENLLTEINPQIKLDYEKEREEKDNEISNQKQLSDLYANNFTLVYDDLLKDFKASNKEKIKSDKGEVVKQKFNTITNSDGYDDFGDTKYVNPSCMLEFYSMIKFNFK